MKKITVLLLTVLLVFVLAGCSGNTLPEKTAAPSTAQNTELTPEELEEQKRLAEIERRKAQIDGIVENMTLEEKVGQLFFLRCPSEDAPQTAERYHLGGILLFTADYKKTEEEWLTKDEFCEKINSMQTSAKNDTGVPLFIGSDEEGGTVTRASRNPNLFSEKLCSPQELLEQGGITLLVEETLKYNTALRSLGINVNFAPVCDITSGPEQFMFERSFGQDAQTTADYISKVVSAFNEAKTGATLKHFPGYGDNVDTHTGIAVDDRPFSQFEAEDFLPFIAGIEAGAPFVMVNHNIVNCMDSTLPASLSPEVHKVLREKLGFDGVILTDDLDMSAVKEYAEEGNIGVLALKAGNDMLVCSDLTQIDSIVNAVNNGTLDESVVDNACRHILTVKQNLGIIN